MGKTADECQLDVDAAERARALHRVVRAMHDGHCPRCGHLANADSFVVDRHVESERHECPQCAFAIFSHEAIAALAEFQPYLRRSVDVFEQWRSTAGQTTVTAGDA